VIDVSKHGHHVATLRPSEGYYDSGEPAQGSVGHLIGGQAVSHISMSAGVTRDVWTAIAPNLSTPALQRIVTVGNRTLPPDQAEVAIGFLARAYLKAPPPAQFHFIVSPLVMWIWIGGLIVFGGGLIAIWPAPSAVRRRVSVRSRARAAHGLARA
jgi:cytochrome c-type biogenesis protein CcmF